MTVYYIDMSKVTSKEKLHDTIKRELPLPEYTGTNLDALHDVLTEAGKDWNIILFNTVKARKKLGPYFDRFEKMCVDAMLAKGGLRIRIYP